MSQPLLWPDGRMQYEPILFSLKNAWLKRIVGGDKKHEFRRAFIRRPSCAFAYLVAPDSVITHVIWLGQPVAGRPEQIALIGERERLGGGISLLEYFGDRENVFAAPIETIRPIAVVTLAELAAVAPGFRPPQSYLILRNHPALLSLLMDRAKGVISNDIFGPT